MFDSERCHEEEALERARERERQREEATAEGRALVSSQRTSSDPAVNSLKVKKGQLETTLTCLAKNDSRSAKESGSKFLAIVQLSDLHQPINYTVIILLIYNPSLMYRPRSVQCLTKDGS